MGPISAVTTMAFALVGVAAGLPGSTLAEQRPEPPVTLATPTSSSQEASPVGPVETDQDSVEAKDYETVSIRGRVVWLADALKRRFGVNVVREANERILALETPDGQLLPIIEDSRGRSFRQDKRLREMDLELLVRRYRSSPLIQVLHVHEVIGDDKFVVDYWCDVCAFVMFESGPCSCCQDQNQLRKRPVKSLGS